MRNVILLLICFAIVPSARAAGVALSGAGPSLVAFSAENHAQIATAMQAELDKHHASVDAWVLDVDRQGAQVEVLVA